jgi:hypothetical protein
LVSCPMRADVGLHAFAETSDATAATPAAVLADVPAAEVLPDPADVGASTEAIGSFAAWLDDAAACAPADAAAITPAPVAVPERIPAAAKFHWRSWSLR